MMYIFWARLGSSAREWPMLWATKESLSGYSSLLTLEMVERRDTIEGLELRPLKEALDTRPAKDDLEVIVGMPGAETVEYLVWLRNGSLSLSSSSSVSAGSPEGQEAMPSSAEPSGISFSWKATCWAPSFSCSMGDIALGWASAPLAQVRSFFKYL